LRASNRKRGCDRHLSQSTWRDAFLGRLSREGRAGTTHRLPRTRRRIRARSPKGVTDSRSRGGAGAIASLEGIFSGPHVRRPGQRTPPCMQSARGRIGGGLRCYHATAVRRFLASRPAEPRAAITPAVSAPADRPEKSGGRARTRHPGERRSPHTSRQGHEPPRLSAPQPSRGAAASVAS